MVNSAATGQLSASLQATQIKTLSLKQSFLNLLLPVSFASPLSRSAATPVCAGTLFSSMRTVWPTTAPILSRTFRPMPSRALTFPRSCLMLSARTLLHFRHRRMPSPKFGRKPRMRRPPLRHCLTQPPVTCRSESWQWKPLQANQLQPRQLAPIPTTS